MKLEYPQTRRTDHLDVLHGVSIPDPYRWMEDIDSEETHAWIEAQNQLTQAYLDKVPMREQIRQRMTELWDYEKFGIPEVHAGRYFYTYNTGLENQDVLYWMQGLDGEARC
jgi:prolyl oligopeptidase